MSSNPFGDVRLSAARGALGWEFFLQRSVRIPFQLGVRTGTTLLRPAEKCGDTISYFIFSSLLVVLSLSQQHRSSPPPSPSAGMSSNSVTGSASLRGVMRSEQLFPSPNYNLSCRFVAGEARTSSRSACANCGRACDLPGPSRDALPSDRREQQRLGIFQGGHSAADHDDKEDFSPLCAAVRSMVSSLLGHLEVLSPVPESIFRTGRRRFPRLRRHSVSSLRANAASLPFLRGFRRRRWLQAITPPIVGVSPSFCSVRSTTVRSGRPPPVLGCDAVPFSSSGPQTNGDESRVEQRRRDRLPSPRCKTRFFSAKQTLARSFRLFRTFYPSCEVRVNPPPASLQHPPPSRDLFGSVAPSLF